MEQWVEHYSELYPRENSVVDSALDPIEPVPIMEDRRRTNTGRTQQGYRHINVVPCSTKNTNDETEN